MEAKIYNQTGKEVGKFKLPEKVFGAKEREALVHQVVVSMMSNARAGTAHTKMRGEVSGTTRKPWKQKGTGRARHGSRRSPIWVGGGVAHGPRSEKDYSKKINKKMRAEALYSVISGKLKDGEILFVDQISLDTPKSKDAKTIVSNLAKLDGFSGLSRRKNAALIALSGRNESVEKSFQNFGNLEISQVKDINPVEVLKYKYLIIENPEKSVETLSARSSK